MARHRRMLRKVRIYICEKLISLICLRRTYSLILRAQETPIIVLKNQNTTISGKVANYYGCNHGFLQISKISHGWTKIEFFSLCRAIESARLHFNFYDFRKIAYNRLPNIRHFNGNSRQNFDPFQKMLHQARRVKWEVLKFCK